MIDLSILICSLQNRRPLLVRLMQQLNSQKTPNIEILIQSDYGQISIGKKRNNLIYDAQGKYIVFCDDDDTVTDNYIPKISEAIKTEPDCCGIEGIITFDGKNPKKFIHSLRYDHWYEENQIYYRTPNHLNPVKKEIAIQVPFKEVNFGEDSDYSSRIYPLLKTEVYIDIPIYNYLYVSKKLIRHTRNLVPPIIRRRER